MNIKEAKQEIINAVKAYTQKDETGAYMIPSYKQRPLLLIGPPGIGKTAIMEQVAQECGIGLVSYTITHHTRQSAIGLPYISHKTFGGQDVAVTEYTMSEIIASVYEQIESSGVQEGILFLDEINCVSETLAPTMLQFLQYKTFGSHKVPDGFIIVTAGNPPQYNKSVRDFDIVTLDRVRKIEITEDFQAWKEYAYQAGVHGAVLAYLEIRKQNFYSIRTEIEERYFVTARGWEDLSQIIKVSERADIPVTQQLVEQYIQDPEIARDFATYYELFNKYRKLYRVPEILEGQFPDSTTKLSSAPFDEKLSLIELLIDSLNGEFRAYAENRAVQENLLAMLKTLKQTYGENDGQSSGNNASAGGQTQKDAAEFAANAQAQSILEAVLTLHQTAARELAHRVDAHMIGREEERQQRLVLAALENLEQTLAAGAQTFADVQEWFADREEARQDAIDLADAHLSNSFSFMAKTFGEGQEMVIFLSELTAGYYSLQFVNDCGNDAYYKYNKLLLLKDRQSELRSELLQLDI